MVNCISSTFSFCVFTLHFFQNDSDILFLPSLFNNIPKPAEPIEAKSLVLLLAYHQQMLGALNGRAAICSLTGAGSRCDDAEQTVSKDARVGGGGLHNFALHITLDFEDYLFRGSKRGATTLK